MACRLPPPPGNRMMLKSLLLVGSVGAAQAATATVATFAAASVKSIKTDGSDGEVAARAATPCSATVGTNCYPTGAFTNAQCTAAVAALGSFTEPQGNQDTPFRIVAISETVGDSNENFQTWSRLGSWADANQPGCTSAAASAIRTAARACGAITEQEAAAGCAPSACKGDALKVGDACCTTSAGDTITAGGVTYTAATGDHCFQGGSLCGPWQTVTTGFATKNEESDGVAGLCEQSIFDKAGLLFIAIIGASACPGCAHSTRHRHQTELAPSTVAVCACAACAMCIIFFQCAVMGLYDLLTPNKDAELSEEDEKRP